MEKNILFTLEYFDMFEYPLRLEELRKWIFKYKLRINDDESNSFLKNKLEKLVNEGKIKNNGEYYFLAGKEKNIEIRKRREKISLKKIKKAQKMARLLAKVPWVRMICIVSNLGYLNADEKADIDFFIVTDKNRIWATRFWCVVLMKLLNQRPNKKTIKNKICLSYFVAIDNMNLQKTAISNFDVHLIYLLSQYLPLYVENSHRKVLRNDIQNIENIWEQFGGDNKWIGEYLPNFNYKSYEFKCEVNVNKYVNFKVTDFIVKSRSRWWKKLMRRMTYNFNERFYKWVQMKILPIHLREGLVKNDKSVIIEEGILKLHSNDKRVFYNRMISDKF